VSDLALLGAVSTATWQIVVGWYQFRAGRRRRATVVGPFDALSKALKTAVTKGERESPEWGSGPSSSGHAHVVSGWVSLSSEAKVTLVEDLLQVAVLTGQLGHLKCVREGRISWSKLSRHEQGQVLAALDGITLDGLGSTVKDNASRLAKSWLWQITEPVPLLAEELLLSEPCVAELTLLTKAFDKADKAVKEVLGAERARVLAVLSAAKQPLDLGPATKGIQALKTLVEGELGLGSAATKRLAQELHTGLSALAAPDGGLSQQAEVQTAAQAMTSEVDAQAADDRETKNKAIAQEARTLEVAHIVQVASTPASWTATSPATLKLALVELVLTELAKAEAAGEPVEGVVGPLVQAAQKLVPKLALPVELEGVELIASQITTMTAALGKQASASPPLEVATTPNETAPVEAAKAADSELVEAEDAAEGEVAETPIAPTVAPTAPAATSDPAGLAQLLAQTLGVQPSTATSDEAVVAEVVRATFSRIITKATLGGVVAAAAAGAKAVSRGEVLAAVLEDAARKADAFRKPALERVAVDGPVARAFTSTLLLNARVASVGPSTSSAERLALAAAYLRDVVLKQLKTRIEGAALPGTLADMAALVAKALDLVRPDQDVQGLESGAVAALMLVREQNDQLALASQLQGGLELGRPGLVTLLDQLAAHCKAGASAAQARDQAEVTAAAAAKLADEARKVAAAAAEAAVAAAPPLKENGLFAALAAEVNEAAAHAADEPVSDGAKESVSTAPSAAVAEEPLTEASSATSITPAVLTSTPTNTPQASFCLPESVPTPAPRSGPSAESFERGSAAVAALLKEGLVLLELSTIESRKLTMLKMAVEGCVAAGSDAVIFNRHLTTLKELSTMLGPILGALESRLAALAAHPERAALLLAVKVSATASYTTLQELLKLENSIRASAVQGAAEARDIVYALKAVRSSAALEASQERLEAVKGKAESIMGAVAALGGSEDAVSEVMVMEEQVDRVMSVQRTWADWVRLREAALGLPTTSAPEDEEDADIELPPIDELAAMHDGEAVFVDMWGIPEPDDDEESESQGKGKAGSKSDDDDEGSEEEGKDDDADSDAEGEAAANARIEGWRQAGCKLISRGQVAVVLLAGALDGDVVRATRDFGLPSTKSPLQLFAERLVQVQRIAASTMFGRGAGILRPLDWYIVAPPASVPALVAFLEDGAYFGLQASQVHVVGAELRPPALSADLKLVMEGPGKIAKSPACSGDLWSALSASGTLGQLTARGARHIEVHCLEDNLMSRPADPVFLGCCAAEGLDAAAKAGDPSELMATYEAYAPLVGTTRGASAFSQLVPALGTYLFSSRWVRQVALLLREEPLALYRLQPAGPRAQPGTLAAAKAAAVASSASTVTYSLGRNMSDWVVESGIPDMDAGIVFVNVDEELALAVGNLPIYIPSSPTAATDALLILHTQWVQAAGGSLEDADQGVIEVSPLVSYMGEDLEGLVAGRTFAHAYELDLQGYAPVTATQRLSLPDVAMVAPFALAWMGLAVTKVLTNKT